MKSILMYLKLRSWLFKSELEYWLSISIVFSMSLVLAVAIFQKTLMMSFLVWNLFSRWHSLRYFQGYARP